MSYFPLIKSSYDVQDQNQFKLESPMITVSIECYYSLGYSIRKRQTTERKKNFK